MDKLKKYWLHYDMDAFFASIEQRDNVNLKNKAVAIGKSIVTTCSYEARKYGVRSTMPVSEAKRLCPDLIVINPRTNYYFEQGYKIQEYIRKYFVNCSFISCDEGFIDISNVIQERCNKKKIYSDDEIRKEIFNFILAFKRKINQKFALSLSTGVGITKVMAKMATEINKPNGIYIFYTPDEFIDYVSDKKINIFPGIGKKTIELLNRLNIYTTNDLFDKSKNELVEMLGTNRGNEIYDLIRAKSSYIYESLENRNERISIGKEKTYYQYATGEMEILEDLKNISEILQKRIGKYKVYPKTLILKIKYTNFKTITKSKTYDSPLDEKNNIYALALEILNEIETIEDVQLVGLTMTNFNKAKMHYLKLF